MHQCLIVFFMLLASSYINATPNNQLHCLQQIYPALTVGKDKNKVTINQHNIVWDAAQVKDFEQKLNSPTLKETLLQHYDINAPVTIVPRFNHDPGRFRNGDFLGALYGKSKNVIQKNLVKVKWVTYQGKTYWLRFNKQQGAAEALKNVVKELDALPDYQKKFLVPLGGTFNFRKIAGTNRLSAHAYGIAIDINPKKSLYWRWTKLSGPKYPSQIPKKIIQIFEKNGFIWGGRWNHFDTMHFEYRPEIIHCT